MLQRFLALATVLPLTLACQSAHAASGTTQGAAAGGELLPPAKAELEIAVGEGGAPKLSELMKQMTASTGVTFTTSESVRRDLETYSCGVLTSVRVPPEGAWLWVESLLLDRGYQLSIQAASPPWLVSVYPVSARPGEPSVRTNTHVPIERIEVVAHHPALWVSTVLDLPHVDVRQLGNSLRGITTDPTGQQNLVAVGNTNSVIVTGSGRQVLQLVEMLRHVDAAAARAIEQQGSSGEQGQAEGEAR